MNQSIKDVLLAINESIDDDYEGATHSIREDINEADIALLHTYLRMALGSFCCLMSFFTLVGSCAGGLARDDDLERAGASLHVERLVKRRPDLALLQRHLHGAHGVVALAHVLIQNFEQEGALSLIHI